jgi:hypothetical protein
MLLVTIYISGHILFHWGIREYLFEKNINLIILDLCSTVTRFLPCSLAVGISVQGCTAWYKTTVNFSYEL